MIPFLKLYIHNTHIEDRIKSGWYGTVSYEMVLWFYFQSYNIDMVIKHVIKYKNNINHTMSPKIIEQ